jgi:hypothetical protein
MKNKLTTFLLVVLFSFNTINAQTYTEPSNNSIGQSIVPTFTFSFAVSTAYTLKIAIGTTAGDWNTPFHSANVTTNGAGVGTYSLPTANQLTNSVTYYWSVDNGLTNAKFITVASALPYLNYPTNGMELTGTSTSFSWSAGVTGIQYTLQVAPSTDATFGTPANFLVNQTLTSTNYTVNYTTFTQGQLYYWRVISKTIEATPKTINFSNTWQFTMPPLPQPTVSYPLGNVSVYANPPTLYWYISTSNPKINEYLVRYKKDGTAYPVFGLPGAATSNGGYFTTSSINTSVTIPSALTAGQRYNWQVAAWDGTTDKATLTNWSDETGFTIYGDQAFVVCYPSFPVGGGIVYSNPPTLYWYTNLFAPGLTYAIEYSTSSTFVGAATYYSTTTSYSIIGQLTPGHWYWRVKASFDATFATSGPWSTPGDFEIQNTNTASSSPVPALSSPTNGTVVSVTNPTLVWFAYSPLPLQYQVIYSADPSMSGGVLNVGTLTTGWLNSNSFILSGLTKGATYYWQVHSRLTNTPNLVSAWSTIAYFTVSAGSAAVVPLAGFPLNGFPINAITTELTFVIPTQSSLALTYNVQYGKKADFSDAVTISNLQTTKVTVGNLDKATTYYWRAASKNSSGSSAYSSSGSFKTEGTTDVSNQVIPNAFELSQNYPNPFNPSTVISYQLAVSSMVTLKIYDVLGREVTTLVNEFQNAGKHNSTFSISNLPAGRQGSQLTSGIYFYTISAGNFAAVKKMILIK